MLHARQQIVEQLEAQAAPLRAAGIGVTCEVQLGSPGSIAQQVFLHTHLPLLLVHGPAQQTRGAA